MTRIERQFLRTSAWMFMRHGQRRRAKSLCAALVEDDPRDGVAAAAYADAVLSPLIMACSATNLKWSAFRRLGDYPSAKGWSVYYGSNGKALSSCHETARSAFDGIMGELASAADGEFPVDMSWPSEAEAGLKAGLVVIHEPDSARLKLSFRAGRHAHELLSQPLYYTEVRFQGDPLK